MMANLYAMAAANPLWAWLAVALLWACGIGIALCLVAMTRRELPLHQWEDDDDQARAITRPAALEKPTHKVDIQPAPNVIPWGRRRHTPADRP